MSYLERLVKEFVAVMPYFKIKSKDAGIISFKRPYWGQRFVLREIAKAKDNQRTFIILKARQLGMTTLLTLFDLFYAMRLEGVKSAILFDSYKNAYRFRYDLQFAYELLPTQFKTLLQISNREMMQFSNTSEIYFLYTSNRSGTKGTAGRGNSFNYLHASEVAYYKSIEDLDTIQASLSDKFPYRLYIYESTANGYNVFYDLWETAKKSPVMKTIFIGWWSKEDNALPYHKDYAEYFRPLEPWEKEFVRKVKAYYGIELSLNQWAWWRMKLQVQFRGNEIMALQELPHTEDEAFQLSGSKYFPASLLQKQFIRAKKFEKANRIDRVKLWLDGNRVYVSPSEEPNLTVFEYPQSGAFYVVGADPSYGANPESDNAVITVYKCTSDKAIQVAEFVDNQVPPQVFARLLLFLAGLYNGALVNLEVNGPGRAVLFEIDELRAKKWMPQLGETFKDLEERIAEGIKYIRDYLYSRPDSLTRSYVRHWATTGDTKAWMFEQLRGALYDDAIEIHSQECLQEMQNIIRDGSYIGADSGFHDDRVIATSLAYEAFIRFGRFKGANLVDSSNSKEAILKRLLGRSFGQ